ncbi:MAG: RsmD family RNA methyltransferase, partial [Chloroflexia bacterium]|nr:RsmD family RNA methyltransferase [Chloroflexia bacterium]
IEALSRGADSADFVEQNAAAAAVVRANIAHTRYEDVSRVHQESVSTFISRAERDPATRPYDLIIMDPPYADPDLAPMLERVGASPLVESGTVLVIGHSPRVVLPERAGKLTRLKQRCHGDSCFSLYEADEREPAEVLPGAGDA